MRLARRGQFLQLNGQAQWPDGTVAVRCGFIHGLYQKVAYDRIGAARQARWHQRIGEREEAGYADRAGAIATELAVHFVAEGFTTADLRGARSLLEQIS